jgi:hypothetical protein
VNASPHHKTQTNSKKKKPSTTMGVVSMKSLATAAVVAVFALASPAAAIEDECKACRAIGVSARTALTARRQHEHNIHFVTFRFLREGGVVRES